MYESVFYELGLTKNESEIYEILLLKGELTVNEIADYSSISRPNIYDVLKKLEVKTFVTSIKKDNKNYFKVTNPENLLLFLKEKEANLLTILPQLKEHFAMDKTSLGVEILQGKKGLKLLMEDMLNSKEIFIFNGLDIGEILNSIPGFQLERYLKEKKRRKIKTIAIYKPGVKPPESNQNYKFLDSKNTLSNVNYWVYSDKVVIGVWSEILVFIKINSAEVAEAFKNNILLVWNALK